MMRTVDGAARARREDLERRNPIWPDRLSIDKSNVASTLRQAAKERHAMRLVAGATVADASYSLTPKGKRMARALGVASDERFRRILEGRSS